MKTQIVLSEDEYNKLLLKIKEKETLIKELENKSYIVHVNHQGEITYIRNFPEKVQKVYDYFEDNLFKISEENRKLIERKDKQIKSLIYDYENLLISIKDQEKRYNQQGWFSRMITKFRFDKPKK